MTLYAYITLFSLESQYFCLILHINLRPAPQRLIWVVRYQRRITAPGRDRVDGCPACNNVVGRYGSIQVLGSSLWAARGVAPPGTLSGPFFLVRH